MTKTYKVIVELYNLLITARKDDRFGRVLSTGSLKIDDLIAIAFSRRSDINPATMKAVYEMLRETALEELCNGKLVEFGLTHCGLTVNGPFIGDHPAWKAGEHSLSLLATAAADVRKAIKNVKVEVHGMASSGIYVNTLTDITSGKVNTCLTPGGAVNLAGFKIKIAGNAPEVGIYLTKTDSATAIKIPSTSIALNEPSRILLIVPQNLPAGDYRLSIVTQYAPNVPLKEPRTYLFDYVLTCG
jgi:hypothetical protein